MCQEHNCPLAYAYTAVGLLVDSCANCVGLASCKLVSLVYTKVALVAGCSVYALFVKSSICCISTHDCTLNRLLVTYIYITALMLCVPDS